MSYSLIKDHTTINYTKGNSGRKYIVLHYTGNSTDTARANTNYFRNTYRGASAHYFVDASTVYEVVDPDNTAWAVGRNFGGDLFGKCTNGNSISIEMCSTSGKISSGTFDNAVALTKYLMARYNIPADNVVRHYDVCAKHCPGWPGWLPNDQSIWKKFKAAVPAEEDPEPVPLPTVRGDLEEMQCTYTIDGGNTVYWFDGQRIHKLTHPDQLKVIRDIYKANTGHDMPSFKWKSSAPYYMRLEQAISLPAK